MENWRNEPVGPKEPRDTGDEVNQVYHDYLEIKPKKNRKQQQNTTYGAKRIAKILENLAFAFNIARIDRAQKKGHSKGQQGSEGIF